MLPPDKPIVLKREVIKVDMVVRLRKATGKK
jgi:hypothetical protein